jgi:hypothetical protein
MVQHGINVDSKGRFNPTVLDDLGVDWAAYVPIKDYGVPVADQARGGGRRKVLARLARESFETVGIAATDFERGIAYWRDRLDGKVDAIELGNEGDSKGGSSWTMSPFDAQRLLEVGARLWPNITRVGPGLVDADFDYPAKVARYFGARRNVHPYDQRPYAGYPDWGHGQIQDLLGNYQSKWPSDSGSLWITEWGRTTTDPGLQASYVEAMGPALGALGVEVAIYFCYADWMVPPYGLLNANDRPNTAYDSFKRMVAATKEVRMSDPQEVADLKNRMQILETQFGGLVLALRRELDGNRSAARGYVDDIDPKGRGTWTTST